MTKAQYTPGPWRFTGNGGEVTYRSTHNSGREYEIARAFSGDTFDSLEANARLIAAAPELLEALTELVKFVPDYLFHANQQPDVDFDVVAELFSARAAIAKATGTEASEVAA